MAGRAEVVLPAEKARPTVPVAAVAREGVDRFVFVEEASAAGASEYRKKSVALGRRTDARVEILAGELFPGDRVVVRGAHELGGLFAPGVAPDPVVIAKLEERRAARAAKDFKTADAIRADLLALGYAIKDAPGGKVEVSRAP